MLASVDLPAEFHGPVAYFDRWLWYALLGVLLVVLYYAAVLWFTRSRQTGSGEPPAETDHRAAHLEEIDRIEHAATHGEISVRLAHQRLSEVVRRYVDLVTGLPATTMSLADFKATTSGELATVIELMYPPEFAPGEDSASERLEVALHQARRLVTTWS